jgi:hypothetical protein
MANLVFSNIDQQWRGNDYRHVSMTSVALGTESPFALIFMTHMNLDFDGAPNAYGPDNLDPLDTLDHAGQDTHYYGVMSVKPTPQNPVDESGMINAPDKPGLRVKVDPDQPDARGYLPVVQQTGKFKGYYVSTTSKGSRARGASTSKYEQSHYLDSGSVAYGVPHTGIGREGVGDGDLGIAIRLDNFRTASFSFLGGEGGSGKTYHLGECSYKVFLDIGGRPKKKTQRYANNNFPTCFVVCPGKKYFPHTNIALADNPGDFAAFIALQGQADAAARGTSGLVRFNEWVAGGRANPPAHSDAIYAALGKYIPLIL